MSGRRNFSTVEYFKRLADRLGPPALAFKGRTKEDWARWREEFGAKLRELYGEWPERVPLNPETVYRVETDDGLILEKVMYDTEAEFSVPALLLIPKDRSRAANGKLPAIMCLHGHAESWAYGKAVVAGAVNANRPDIEAEVRKYNYDYGRRMARRGYVVLCPDARAFGELSDGGNPYPGRDPCNVHFNRGLLLGFNLLTLNIWDTMRGLDYLQARPEVDPDRIGAMGLSFGGTLTMYLTALDERIRAADICCYLITYRYYAIERANFCGSQYLPHMYRWGDVPDIAGLIAPRPLLIQCGVHETGFRIEPVLEAVSHLKEIYKAAGCPDRLSVDVFEGGHEFHEAPAFEFFERWLAGG